MRIIRIELDAPSLPESLCSSSLTLLSSFVMMLLSSSSAELSVGAIADVLKRGQGQWTDYASGVNDDGETDGRRGTDGDATASFMVKRWKNDAVEVCALHRAKLGLHAWMETCHFGLDKARAVSLGPSTLPTLGSYANLRTTYHHQRVFRWQNLTSRHQHVLIGCMCCYSDR